MTRSRPAVMFWAALLLATAPASAPAQGDAEGPAARRARELLGVVNDGDLARLRAFIDSTYAPSFLGIPMDVHVEFLLDLRDGTRGVELHGFQEIGPTLATALYRTNLTGDWGALAVRVEDEPPHRIMGLGPHEPQPPAEARRVRRATDAEIARELDAYLKTLAGADLFSGAVLVAKGSTVIFRAAYGHANKDFEIANRIDTKFNLGSMNKMFTAVAIAQLVEKGMLSFDDPLSKFVPDFPDSTSAKRIRIEHLLTHTSGLGSYFTDEFFRTARGRLRSVDDFLTLARGDSLAFEPGTRWRYSNTGFLVLGKVIEVVTGQSYFDYIRANLYGPARMIHSGSFDLDEVNPNLAVGYEKGWTEEGTPRWKNNLFEHVIRGGPAGGGYSTVEDLWRFTEALRVGRLVGKVHVEILTTPKPELGSPEYGYGFGVGEGWVGHSGGFQGISSNLDWFRESGFVAVVLANYGRASFPVVEKIRRLVLEPQHP